MDTARADYTPFTKLGVNTELSESVTLGEKELLSGPVTG